MPRIAIPLAAAVLAAVAALSAAAGPPPGHGQKVVFGSNRADGQRDLYVVNEDGTGERRLTFDGEDYRERVATWSPDGSRIAYAALHNGNFDIYTIDANGGDRRRVTTDPARDDYPSWTNGGRIMFTRGLFSNETSVWVVNADGSNEQRLALPGPHAFGADMAPRGNRFVYTTDATGLGVVHVATLNGTTVSGETAVSDPAHDGLGDQEPKWSPNGNDIVYLHDHGNVDNDIFVVHSDGTGQKQLTNTPNRAEFWANWSSDGKEVMFQDGSSGKLRAIDVASGAERLVGTTPRAPFTDDFSGPQDSSVWGLNADPGGTATQADGQVRFTISGTAQPGGQYNQVSSIAYTKCDLEGDYDMQVDYTLLAWPHLGGFYATLNAYWRTSVPVPWAPNRHDDQVVGWTEDGNGGFATADASGTLRMVKKNGLVVEYVRDGDGWRPVGSGHSSTDGNVGFQLNEPAQDFGHMDGAVAFDNFALNSGTFSCPGWWQDFFPDVFYG
jgi:Tol biopolymer transport system component